MDGFNGFQVLYTWAATVKLLCIADWRLAPTEKWGMMTLRCCFWPIFTAYNLHIICTKNRLNSLGLEDMCVRNSSSQPDSSVNQKSLKIPHEIIKVYTFPFTIFCLLWLWNNLDFKMFVHQGTITASLGLQYIKGYLLRHHLSTVRLIFQRNDLMKHFWNIRSRNQLLNVEELKKIL